MLYVILSRLNLASADIAKKVISYLILVLHVVEQILELFEIQIPPKHEVNIMHDFLISLILTVKW